MPVPCIGPGQGTYYVDENIVRCHFRNRGQTRTAAGAARWAGRMQTLDKHEKQPGVGAFFWRSLSARLLLLTILFVMIAEVLIFVPSVARYRVSYLQQMMNEAGLAAVSVLAAPDNMISDDLKNALLDGVGVRGIVMKRTDQRILLLDDGMPPQVDQTYDLRASSPLLLVRDAMTTLTGSGDRTLRVIDRTMIVGGATVEILMDETALYDALVEYGRNILSLSLVISLISASFLYLALRRMLVVPVQRMTQQMMAFRRSPETAQLMDATTKRGDEIGVAERALGEMQQDLRTALKQKTHLAALGGAVSKINHDMRNMLSTAQMVSDLLAGSEDPMVRRLAPRLIDSVDRAINLCTRTLRYGRAEEPDPDKCRFLLHDLVAEILADLTPVAGGQGVQLINDVAADLQVKADREQLFRVLMNLSRNAVQVLGADGALTISAVTQTVHEIRFLKIRVSDNGPGLPPAAQENLFKPFVGSARSGGTGLGLVIARDLMIAHGGDIELVRTGDDGTVFELRLPDD